MPRESGASSNHRVMGCAPIENKWLLDRPLSRAMTLLEAVIMGRALVSSPAGLTRGSIFWRERKDCRVKPGNDGAEKPCNDNGGARWRDRKRPGAIASPARR